MNSPKKVTAASPKRRRIVSSATGLSPKAKFQRKEKVRTLWSPEEKASILEYVDDCKGKENVIWSELALFVNAKYHKGLNIRNGKDCQTTFKRIQAFPSVTHSKVDVGVQTDTVLTTNSTVQTVSCETDVGNHLGTDVLDVYKKTAQTARDVGSKAFSLERSILYTKDVDSMKNFSWEDVEKEFQARFPETYNLCKTISTPPGRQSDQVIGNRLGLIYGIMMKTRCQEMALVQHVISAVLMENNVPQKVFDDLNPMGISMSYDTAWRDLEKMATKNKDELVQSVQEGQNFRLVGDNINFRVGVKHIRQGKAESAKDWFGSIAVVTNQNFDSLPDVAQGKIADLPLQKVLVSDREKDMLRDCFIQQTLEVISDHSPALQFMAKYGPGRPDGPHNKQDKIHMLHVLPYNEMRYQDMISVLKEYEKVVVDVYEKAACNTKKVQIGGDQLTRERMSGAKGLVVVEKDSQNTLSHLTPVTFELFHLQMNFLTMMYKQLYKESGSDIATMHSEKIRLSRNNVHTDVKNHYEACKDFALSFTNCYIIEALCSYFEVDSLTDLSSIDIPAKNASTKTKQEWVKRKLGHFVDTYVLSALKEEQTSPQPDQTAVVLLPVTLTDGTIQYMQLTLPVATKSTKPDFIRRYAHNVLEIGMLYKELLHVCHHPDRTLFLAIMKDVMQMLKAHNFQGKYGLEILRFLFHQYAGLSEKVAHQSFHGLFVNTSGKQGNCIPADLAMEHNVRKCKDILKCMGPNKTEHAISVKTEALPCLETISSNYRSNTGCIHRCSKHSVPSAHEDELFMIKDLRSLRPFDVIPGRAFSGFGSIPKSLKSSIDFAKYTNWIHNKKVVYDIEHGK